MTSKPTKQLICFYCDQEMTKLKTTKDHIIPRMLGGTNHDKNKVKCCRDCNSLKANYLPSHLAQLIEWFYIPRAENPEKIVYLRRIYLKCIDLEVNHIPKYKHNMIKKPFNTYLA